MTRFNKRLGIAAAAGALLILTAFAERDSIRKFRTDQKNRAAVQDYLQQKYGFRGTIGETGSVIYYYTAAVREQDTFFQVILDSDGKPLLDTYQYDAVTAAVKAQIREAFPDCLLLDLRLLTPVHYQEKTGDTIRFPFGLGADTLFDGTNLDAVLTGCLTEVTAYYADTDFADCALFGKLTDWNTVGRFVSFDTEAHAEMFLQSGRIPALAADEPLYAPYITQIRVFDTETHQSRITGYPMQEGDGFRFCCPAVPDVQCREADPVTDGAVSQTYWFDSAENPVYVYYPLESLPDYENLTVVCATPDGKSRTGTAIVRCGDYAVFELNGVMNPSWALVQKQQ